MAGSVELLDIAAAVVFACCLILLAVVWRRTLLRHRGAAVDLCVRDPVVSQGWVLGIGRFTGNQLEWFRLFSMAPRPRCTFHRADLAVLDRRRPTPTELMSLMTSAVVISCRAPAGPVELAMSESAVTGFLAWLEAAPPGATLPTIRD
ncbi:MAG: DUF2550 domain-containing protein [Frankiaceae bacterium]